VWTIQPVETWERLQTSGRLYTDGRRIPSELRFAYRWMRQQMQSRISGYGGRYPWWGWAYPKPDLRRAGHLPRSTRGVRLELELLDEEALVSDFNAWHAVLNRGYLALTPMRGRRRSPGTRPSSPVGNASLIWTDRRPTRIGGGR
jgi:hypothetical protein